MTFNELEIKFVNWFRGRFCLQLPERSISRVVAETALLLKMGQLEQTVNQKRKELEALGIIDADGNVDTAKVREVLIPAINQAGGGIDFDVFGTKIIMTPKDIEAMIKEDKKND